jgi:hypothetical protein
MKSKIIFKKLAWVVLIVLSFNVKLIAQDLNKNSGNLLIICDEGFRVYVDDDLKGFTNKDQDGLFIQNIKVGPHTATIKKSGLKDYSFNVEIESGKTVEHEYKKYLQSEDTDSKALVYIFRPGRMSGKWVPYTVHVDDELVSESKLGNKTYLTCWVEPGEHTFWHGLHGSTESITIDCKAGETYYIKAKTAKFYISTKEEWEKERKKLKRRF